MKTQGITIVSGSIVMDFPQSIPPAFWARLKHAVDRAVLRPAFLSDRAVFGAASADSPTPWLKQEALFMRWYERLGFPKHIWPWERGWTEEAVDAYLQAAPVRPAPKAEVRP